MVKPLLSAIVILLVAGAALAQPKSAAKPATPQPIREIFVPFEDLNVILENDKHRVFLTREEYEALIEQAKSKPEVPAPYKVVLLGAQYEGELEDGRAVIHGTITLEVLEDGLFAYPLDIGGVGIRSATLDGKPAALYAAQIASAAAVGAGQGEAYARAAIDRAAANVGGAADAAVGAAFDDGDAAEADRAGQCRSEGRRGGPRSHVRHGGEPHGAGAIAAARRPGDRHVAQQPPAAGPAGDGGPQRDRR